MGCTVDLSPLNPQGIAADRLLFAETPGLVVLSALPEHRDRLQALAAECGLPLCELGSTGGERLVVEDLLDLSLHEVAERWWCTLERRLEA